VSAIDRGAVAIRAIAEQGTQRCPSQAIRTVSARLGASRRVPPRPARLTLAKALFTTTVTTRRETTKAPH
jgi:hypothetical protein